MHAHIQGVKSVVLKPFRMLAVAIPLLASSANAQVPCRLENIQPAAFAVPAQPDGRAHFLLNVRDVQGRQVQVSGLSWAHNDAQASPALRMNYHLTVVAPATLQQLIGTPLPFLQDANARIVAVDVNFPSVTLATTIGQIVIRSDQRENARAPPTTNGQAWPPACEGFVSVRAGEVTQSFTISCPANNPAQMVVCP